MQVMDKGTKAFVSYVRGYKEHHCKYVFQLADLSLEHVGYMFGLLRLPVMKEVSLRPTNMHMHASPCFRTAGSEVIVHAAWDKFRCVLNTSA